MPRTNPFTVTIYSKTFAFQQRLGSAQSYSFTPRWTLGSGEIVTRSDDPANTLLAQPGARLVVEYRGEVLMSGLIQQRTGSIVAAGTNLWEITDDRFLLTATRAWVRPGANLTPTSLSDTAQMVPASNGHTDGRADGTGYYAFPAPPVVYPAESAIKQVIRENLARFPPSTWQGQVTVAPDQGRGPDARAAGMLPQLRMDSLHDGLLDLLDWANLWLRVFQTPNPPGTTGSLQLDVFQPTTWSQVIGAQSRIISDGTFQQSIPTVTRPILGGPGDDAGRLFYAPPPAADLEALYGFAVETFTDATGASLNWPAGLEEAAQVAMYYLQRTDVASADKVALTTYLQQAGATALSDGLPRNGLSIDLSESASFHYGGSGGYHVGDLITVTAANGPTITERITEVELTYSADGFTVTPTVGDITDDATTALAQGIASIAKAVSRLQSRQ